MTTIALTGLGAVADHWEPLQTLNLRETAAKESKPEDHRQERHLLQSHVSSSVCLQSFLDSTSAVVDSFACVYQH